jgi:hypothetical protein
MDDSEWTSMGRKVQKELIWFRGHPMKNLELPISTRTDCEVVNTG